MKVKDALARKKSMEDIFHNLQKLELLFRNNEVLRNQVDEAADTSIPR